MNNHGSFDIMLFDPQKVSDNATFDYPHQYSKGFDYVIVNGIAGVADGELTDNRPGRFLKHKGP